MQFNQYNHYSPFARRHPSPDEPLYAGTSGQA